MRGQRQAEGEGQDTQQLAVPIMKGQILNPGNASMVPTPSTIGTSGCRCCFAPSSIAELGNGMRVRATRETGWLQPVGFISSITMKGPARYNVNSKPSTGGSPNAKHASMRSGSPTTGAYAPSSWNWAR